MAEPTCNEECCDEPVPPETAAAGTPQADTPRTDIRAGASHRRHLYPSRPHRASVRLSDHEYEVIATAAARSGMRLASWIGRAALTVAGAREAGEPTGSGPVVDWTQQADIHAELIAARRAVDRVGANLNQAVTALHATGQAPPMLVEIATRVEAAVERLEQAATAARVPRR